MYAQTQNVRANTLDAKEQFRKALNSRSVFLFITKIILLKVTNVQQMEYLFHET